MKTCLITGISSGIGREVAIKISKEKQFQNIAMIGRNKKAIEETILNMDQNNVNIKVWEADLSYPEQVIPIVNDIYNNFKSIDCVLNIAGYTDPKPLLSTTLDNLNLTYNVNVFSPLLIIRESVRYMKKSGGKILNVASTAGITSRPGWISYASSKAAIISVSQTLADELAEYGIRVYCVSPGRCATKLRKRLAPNEDPSSIMQPEEVADVICRLIAEDECCLDGQNIIIRKQIRK